MAFGLDDLDLPVLNPGNFSLFGGGAGGGIDFGNFNLGGGGIGGLNLSGIGGGGGGGGSFDWSKLGNVLGPIGDIGKFGLGAWQAIQQQSQMKNYQDALKHYQSQMDAYNAAQMDFLRQKQDWANQMMGMVGGAQGSLEEIMNQELGAAQPLLSQSQELIEPAVAALAKGEVPPLFEPILNSARQRLMAANRQQFLNAGRSAEEADAAMGPAVDQQLQAMLLQQVTQMLQSGQGLAQQGGQMLGLAGGSAGQEFGLMQQAISNLLGGNFQLGGMPAPPVA